MTTTKVYLTPLAWVAALVLAVSAFLAGSVTADEDVPTTSAEHLAAAEEYEAKAAEQDAIATEHFEMMKQYRAKAYRYPKQIREKRLAAMRKHCNAIIRDARSLAGDYRAMAKWHRTMAADLERASEAQMDSK